jgi:hypothetical protein
MNTEEGRIIGDDRSQEWKDIETGTENNCPWLLTDISYFQSLTSYILEASVRFSHFTFTPHFDQWIPRMVSGFWNVH